MKRPFPPSLAALALVLATHPASAAERPKPTPPEMPPFEVAQPYPNTWYGRFGKTNCSWIDMGDGVLVIDTGATAADAKNLKAEIARTTKNKPIKWIAMTNLRPETNDGFVAFLPTDATLFVNARAMGYIAGLIAKREMGAPHVIGISDRLALAAGKQTFEIGVPARNAYTALDLYVFDASERTVFAGGLVTTNRCPTLLDPDSDLKGWIATLDRFDTLGPRGLVPSWGNPTGSAGPEIEKTRRYIAGMLAFLIEKKKENAPEARVSGELVAEKLADYCPREQNALNALSVYRRLQSDGTMRPGSAAAKPSAK
jgi:glyoxylase-like metal-dependent hydrolase (beta-lactamase superfamily II)